jgi:hypothetical protein
VLLLLGLAGVVVVALVVAMVLVFRRHRQTAELQKHFHSAYDETARWNPLDDGEGPISRTE